MKIITKKEFLANEKFYIDEIIKGKIFVYPTDTIYGIGCNGQIISSVKKIREIKNREDKPFSIIAPSKDWIINNCSIDLDRVIYLKKIPGAYTLILKLKNENAIAKKEVIGDTPNIGIRIPKNWFSKIIAKSSVPFITTSVNISGQKHINKIEDIDKNMILKIDYIIDDGQISGNPSTIINLTKEKVEIIERK